LIENTFTEDQLLLLIAKCCILSELDAENKKLKAALTTNINTNPIIGNSQKTSLLMEQSKAVANLDVTILVTGESGTGKTTLAQHIHNLSLRKNHPFISLSCAAFPKDLIESELFGYEKGAFTSANSSRPGSVELANKGTLFLDEIGELPLEVQSKLLTLLQDKTVKRLGSNKFSKVDVRIIAATNKDLNLMMTKGEFRQDLFFRLNVINLVCPPLRERKEDIIEIANYYLEKISKRRNCQKYKLSKTAQDLLINYFWPGNIRELENLLERATAFSKGFLLNPDDFELNKLEHSIVAKLDSVSLAGYPLAEIEKKAISDTLKLCEGNKEKAAVMLGVSVKTIYNKLK
jgi:transcriptional regulator with PAS, ATPase and Fis domain